MTNEQAEALGRRWIAAGGGWRRGMIDNYGRSVLAATSCTVTWDRYMDVPDQVDRPNSAWPVLRDPATRGAALEVVRERWGDPTAYVRYSHEWKSWYAYAGTWCPVGGAHDSEEAALVAALEAAPSTTRGTDAGTTGTGRR